MEKIPLSEYPRPQFKRDSYICLNGYWDYRIQRKGSLPKEWDGKILVPYSPETPLSGVNKKLSQDDYLFYRLKFTLPKEFIKDKVILHFGAVDQSSVVLVNGNMTGVHIGGYTPFEYDIKQYLIDGENELIVRVSDVSDYGYHSIGKQREKRGGIWYTAQSGIWMPVWLESVQNGYIENIKITPNIDDKNIKILVKSSIKSAKVHLFDKDVEIETNKETIIPIDDMHLWSPEDPYLYEFSISNEIDKVDSYFAMRKFSIMEDEKGIKRLALNNKPYFMKGVLDQGYYRNGFLTHECDDDYIKDIQLVKSLGFNTIRKHIKVESLRWYYHCDRLGIIVWQDFINGGSHYKLSTISFPLIFGIHHKDNNYKKFSRIDKNGRQEAREEFKEIINLLYNCPSIGLWTIFNEGWGQFDSTEIYEELRKLDPSRLFDHASGWHDQGVSDVKSLHVYFKKVNMPNAKAINNRAVILSECGGYTLPIKEHMFSKKEFGYKKIKDEKDFIKTYDKFMERDILRNIPKGLSAFIYTQLSDVEDELNGFITYDRQVVKINPDSIKRINEKATFE